MAKYCSFDRLLLTRGSLITCLVFTLFTAEIVQAEVPGYRFTSVRTILGPCCTDQGTDLVVDSHGAILIAGSRGGLDLDRDGSIDVQTFGSPDPLIIKTFENEKKHEGWVQGPGGPKADAANGIASDRKGGLYVAGNFLERMSIAAGSIDSAGKKDGFIAHYNQAGEAQWAKAIGGVDFDDLADIASDSEGNIYVVGTVRGAVDIDRDDVVDVTASGESSLLIASFEPTGKLRWAQASGGASYTLGRAIAAGASGEIYVAGLYSKGAPDLNGDSIPDAPATTGNHDARVTPQTDMNAFFARFDSSGKMAWSKTVAGPAVQAIGSLAVAHNGDLLVLGGNTGSVDLDADGSIDIPMKSMRENVVTYQADGNTFLLRVAPDGKRRWARRYLGTGAHVAADASRIVISGTYTGPLDLDGDGQVEREADSDSRQEGFAAILDNDGQLRHVFSVVGGDADVVNAAGFSPDGKRLYVTGYSKLGADFDNDGKLESASACHQLGDLFLAFYDVTETTD